MEFYKANKANKGCGIGFSFDSKRGGTYSIYVDFIKQNGWDQSKNQGKGGGIFKGGVQNKIKLSIEEAGLLVKCINSEKALGDYTDGKPLYHLSSECLNLINFNKYVKDSVLKGFTFQVSKKEKGDSQSNTFTVGLTIQEAEILRIWLEYALHHIFDGKRSEDIQRRKEMKKKYENQESEESPSSSESNDVPF